MEVKYTLTRKEGMLGDKQKVDMTDKQGKKSKIIEVKCVLARGRTDSRM